MRRAKKIFSGVLFAAFSAAASLMPLNAGAWTSHNYRYDRHVTHYENDYWWHAERMERDRIAAEEEERREVAREKRRDEIEAARKAYQKDYLARRQAIRDASRAAGSAPRGYYYRKPGFTTASLPPASVELEVAGKTYSYVSGIFYMQVDPNKFAVVPAPAGAVVDALPEGSQQSFLKGKPSGYSYYFGTFFREKDGKYEVARPPRGTVVSYLPDGYGQVEEGDTVSYYFGGVRYQPVIYGQAVVYRLAGSS